MGALNFFNLPNLLQPGLQKQRKQHQKQNNRKQAQREHLQKNSLQVILQNSVMWFLSPTAAGPTEDQLLYDRSIYARMDNLLLYKPQK